MRLSRRGLGGCLCLTFAGLMLTGCSGGKGTVTGKVSYQGTVLKGGNVVFMSTEKKPSVSCTINEDGTYTAEGVPTGPVKILVETASLKPASYSQGKQYDPPPGAKVPEGYKTGAADNSKRYVEVPEKYNDPDKTDQLYTVTSGKQEKNIELK